MSQTSDYRPPLKNKSHYSFYFSSAGISKYTETEFRRSKSYTSYFSHTSHKKALFLSEFSLKTIRVESEGEDSEFLEPGLAEDDADDEEGDGEDDGLAPDGVRSGHHSFDELLDLLIRINVGNELVC